MDISHINSSVLRKLLSLSEKKDILLEKIKEIEQEIVTATLGRSPASASKTTPAAPKAPRKTRRGRSGRRGALKDRILTILTAAGESGARVRDIAAQLKIAPQNIHVWFSSTGKKLGIVEKIEAGRYKVVSAVKSAFNAPKKTRKIRRTKKKA